MLAEEGSCGAGAAGLGAEIAARVPAGANGKVGAKGRPRMIELQALAGPQRGLR